MSLRGEIHSNLSRLERVADTLTLGAVSRSRAEEISAARLTEADWHHRHDEALFDLHSALQERAVALGAPRPRLDLTPLFAADGPAERPHESADREAFFSYIEEFSRQTAQAIIALRTQAAAVERGEYDAQIKAGVSLDDVLPDRPTLSQLAEIRALLHLEQGPILSL